MCQGTDVRRGKASDEKEIRVYQEELDPSDDNTHTHDTQIIGKHISIILLFTQTHKNMREAHTRTDRPQLPSSSNHQRGRKKHAFRVCETRLERERE